MRSDLNKVITEHERHGQRGDYGESTKLAKAQRPTRFHSEDDPLDLPQREGMRIKWRLNHNDGKDFADRLGAIRGTLRKNKGKPWDKLYSELSRNFDRNTVSGKHVWGHLMQDIVIHTEMRGKEIWGLDGPYGSWVRMKEPQVYPRRTTYYVHPVTNLIMERPRGPAYKYVRPLDPNLRKTEDPQVEYHKVSGNWVLVRTVTTTRMEPLLSFATGKPVLEEDGSPAMRPKIYKKVTKKGLSSKELKRAGLANDCGLPTELTRKGRWKAIYE
jgi:hypothetical protein